MSFSQLRDMTESGSDKPFLDGKQYHEAMEVLRSAGINADNLKFSFDAEDVVREYAEQLDEADRGDSLEIIELLGWFYRQPRAGQVLVDILEEDDDPVLRQRAAETLAGSGLDTVTDSLFLALELDPVKAVRRAAAFALIMLGALC